MKETGYVLWEGLSQIDGITPVVCIITMNSKNEKTGDMPQTWILLQDVHPNEAVKQNLDYPICGDCVHRLRRSCYVEVWQAPSNIWEAWKRGNYPMAPEHLDRLLKFRMVRFGAYGDPAAVPIGVWDAVADMSRGTTGYTHQWRDHPEFAKYCMASVESAAERDEAKRLGFRTYRVTDQPERIAHKEVMCPAAKKTGVGMSCIDCGHCNGNNTGLSGDVVIPVHGRAAKINRFRQIPMELGSATKEVVISL